MGVTSLDSIQSSLLISFTCYSFIRFTSNQNGEKTDPRRKMSEEGISILSIAHAPSFHGWGVAGYNKTLNKQRIWTRLCAVLKPGSLSLLPHRDFRVFSILMLCCSCKGPSTTPGWMVRHFLCSLLRNFWLPCTASDKGRPALVELGQGLRNKDSACLYGNLQLLGW